MERHAASRSAERRADVDHLRVGALLLLIVYHVLLVYNGGGWWRVSSEHAGYWADYLLALLRPWRMALVFLIGGVAARHMIDRMSTPGFIGDRAAKLLTAFAFALVVLVPVQHYVRLDDNGLHRPPYLDYLLHSAPTAAAHGGVRLPDFAHAWFLVYLFAYSLLAVAVFRAAPGLITRISERLGAAPLWMTIGALALWLVPVEAVLMPRWQLTGYIWDDPTAHAKFLPVFLLGALIAKQEPFWAKLARRWRGLAGAAGALALLVLATEHEVLSQGAPLPDAQAIAGFVRGCFAATMLMAALGFAARLLNRHSVWLAYATDAILPVYLMHQTALVVAADALTFRHVPLPMELAALLALTLLAPLAAYHLAVRRSRVLRMLFGLRPAPRPPPAPAAAAHPLAP